MTCDFTCLSPRLPCSEPLTNGFLLVLHFPPVFWWDWGANEHCHSYHLFSDEACLWSSWQMDQLFSALQRRWLYTSLGESRRLISRDQTVLANWILYISTATVQPQSRGVCKERPTSSFFFFFWSAISLWSVLIFFELHCFETGWRMELVQDRVWCWAHKISNSAFSSFAPRIYWMSQVRGILLS